MREGLPEAQTRTGASIKNDISIPIALIPDFIEEAAKIVTQIVPNCIPTPFGHMGDGNLHYNIMQPFSMERDDFMQHRERMISAIDALVISMKGSISAEHGIGQLKAGKLAKYKSNVEMDMMRAVKNALDPEGIFNPGKI